MLSSKALFQRLVKWCPWLLREEPKQPVKVLVTGAAGTLKFKTLKLKQELKQPF
jgi:hypothetical protein